MTILLKSTYLRQKEIKMEKRQQEQIEWTNSKPLHLDVESEGEGES